MLHNFCQVHTDFVTILPFSGNSNDCLGLEAFKEE